MRAPTLFALVAALALPAASQTSPSAALQALRLFRYYVARYPDDANAHDSLGEALAVAGRTEESIASYERAVALDPDGQTGDNARRQLERLRSAHPDAP